MSDEQPPRTGPFNVADQAARVRRVAVNVGGRARTLNPLERVLWSVVALIAFLIALVLLIPIVLIAGIVLVLVILYVSIRRAFARSGADPSAPRNDGRENVRVIRRE
ncbi:MAG: hypothetical protein AAGI53_02830 [Planctomycetota bacterium]